MEGTHANIIEKPDINDIQAKERPCITDLEQNLADHTLYEKKLELKHVAENGLFRKECARFVQKLTIYCLTVVLSLLIINAFKLKINIDIPLIHVYFNMAFSISDMVMITILTATTANILGLFAIVLKYFYNSSK